MSIDLDSIQHYIKSSRVENLFNKDDFLNLFMPKQLKYILNKDKKNFILYYGGRRAGKSAGNIGKIIYTDLYSPEKEYARIVYASATISKAKELAWKKLQKANERFELKWKFIEKESIIITPRNEIVMRGLKDIPNANKEYGFKIKLVIIDEPHTIKTNILQHYIENACMWGLSDLDGEMCLTFNPPHFPHPYIRKELKNKENLIIQTNIFDNTKLREKRGNLIENFIDKERKRRGLKKGEEDNRFRRDVYGEYLEDTDSLVFRVKEERNFFVDLPQNDIFEKVMGIDIGWDNADAIVVLYYSRKNGIIYVVEEFEKTKQTIDVLMGHIKRIENQHGTIPFKIIDKGGLGKKMTMDTFDKYGVDLITAEKSEKLTYVEFMRAEIDAGRMKFKKNSELVKEFDQIIYDEKKEKLDEKEGYHSDLLDATLYSFRYIYNHIRIKPKLKQDPLEVEINRMLRDNININFKDIP